MNLTRSVGSTEALSVPSLWAGPHTIESRPGQGAAGRGSLPTEGGQVVTTTVTTADVPLK